MDIQLEVQIDYLEKEAAAKPVAGLAELIWNSVDADASHVRITCKRNKLGGLDALIVEDDGHGIEHIDAEVFFGKLGGSWKKNARRSKQEQRQLHGQEGRGRFKAFAIGSTVCWESTYESSGKLKQFRIIGKRETLNTFSVSDPKASSAKQTGTRVEITDIREGVESLDNARAVAEELARRLALYLRAYPTVKIEFDGVEVDPKQVESHYAAYKLDNIKLDDGRLIDAHLAMIEWKIPTERGLYLCDASGFARTEIPPRIQAPGWNFTAYLASSLITELEERAAFALEDMHPDFERLMDAARRKMREHFRKRASEIAVGRVAQWKKEDVYPYRGDPKDVVEQTERQVFDVVATQLAEALPDFDASDSKSKKLSMRLLRQAIEESPDDLQTIFSEVLGLPKEQQTDLAELLKRTSLSSIITASKQVADRLNFIRGLELLLFHPLSREQLLEREQLHKILEGETWLFGEEFAQTVSDQSLNDVLAAHMGLLGKRMDDDSTVLREDGSRGRVDLMLSRLVPQTRANEREHLIVEIKRPSVLIDSSVIDQVESYAFAVARDERFKDSNTRWIFWAVCNDMKDSGHRKANQKDQPIGRVAAWDNPRIEIWAKRWNEVIDSNRARLHFLQQRLQYRVDDQSALEALRRVHAKYLPPVFAEPELGTEK